MPHREQGAATLTAESTRTSEVFETEDTDLAEKALSAAYSSMRIQARSQRQGFRITQTALGPVRLDQIRFGMSFDADSDPLGVLAISELISGRIRCDSDGSERSYRPGDVYLAAHPAHLLTGTVEDAEAHVAVINPGLLGEVAGTQSGRTQHPVRLTGYEPISPQAAQKWKATLAFVRDTVLSAPETAGQTLVAASAARLLAATTLAAFPSNALTDQDNRDAHTATLRRAVAFIDEHAQTAITTADIAAASVTIRALQLAFQRHMDTTPIAYLRRVRLDHAHHELTQASHGDELTVTAVAYRWAFPSHSRFAAAYRHAYGVPPSHTLRHD